MSETDGDKGERIAKVMARAGLCSRRDAERWIAEGRVSLNGERLATPAVTVTADDRVMVDGKPLPAAEAPRIWRYHKLRGVVTTARDPEGRPTVFDALPDDLPRVLSVGRLDLWSEGLLLLTNDGGVKRKMELPATGWTRRYKVRVHGPVTETLLDRLRGGMTVEGVHYAPLEVEIERETGQNFWLAMGLKEGKNREIRRLCQHLGLAVDRLIRIAYGPFQIGALKPGEVKEVPAKVVAEQLGLNLGKTPGQGFAKARPKAGPSRGGKPGRPGKGPKRRGPKDGVADKSGAGRAHRRRPL